MNNDILKDIEENLQTEFENKKVAEIIKDNPDILKEYPELEIEFNTDGTKKSLYSLASERDIKETQIMSDENELDFRYNQKLISKEEYDKEKKSLEEKLKNQNLVYDDLIFDLISEGELSDIKDEIKSFNLNDIDLKRLAASLSSIAENKIDDFQKNNKEFREDKISYWNYKYDKIAKGYARTREIESFILGLIE